MEGFVRTKDLSLRSHGVEHTFPLPSGNDYLDKEAHMVPTIPILGSYYVYQRFSLICGRCYHWIRTMEDRLVVFGYLSSVPYLCLLSPQYALSPFFSPSQRISC